MMHVGIAADHGGFTLKGEMAELLRGAGHEVVDFGAHELTPGDDCPDFIIALARAVAAGEIAKRSGGLRQRRGSVHRREQDSRRACRPHP